MKIYKIRGDKFTWMLTHIGKLIYCNPFSKEDGIGRPSQKQFLFAPYPIADNCVKIDSDWSLGFEHICCVDSPVSFNIIDYVMNLDTDVTVAVLLRTVKNGFTDVHYHIRLYSNGNMAKLVYAPDLGSGVERHKSSSLFIPTSFY